MISVSQIYNIHTHIHTICSGFWVLYDSKLNMFELWTKQDIQGHHPGFWETLINIFHQFKGQMTKQLIKKMIDRLIDNKNSYQVANAMKQQRRHLTSRTSPSNETTEYVHCKFLWFFMTLNSIILICGTIRHSPWALSSTSFSVLSQQSIPTINQLRKCIKVY